MSPIASHITTTSTVCPTICLFRLTEKQTSELRIADPFWRKSHHAVIIKYQPGKISTNWFTSAAYAALNNFSCILRNNLCVNYANPTYGVATICHPVCCLRWGHPSLFHTATSLLIWYTMFCVRDIPYRLIWMKYINMLSVYAKSGTHRRFNW